MPTVTVIIPNYNHARFLEKRIQSVLNQTYQDFDIIYLDDASKDDSAKMFSKYANAPRIRAIYNETNSGSPFKQWNKGVREAKGKYIWIAESDDYADTRLLETLVRQLDGHADVGVAYCQSILVNENDEVTGSAIDWIGPDDAQRWKQSYVNSGQDECCRYLIKQCTIPNASAVLFRRSVFDAAGGADESMRACGDWLLWTKMLMISDVAFVAEPLNFFRKHSASTSRIAFRQGVVLEENYHIVRYILRNANPSKKDIKLTCDGLMATWLYCLCSSEINLAWQQHRKILHHAFRTDRYFLRRLAMRAIISFLNKGRGLLAKCLNRNTLDHFSA